jgi:hypothetical protein
MKRRGLWIWRDRGAGGGLNVNPREDANLFVQLRRTFWLDAPPASAPVRISADGRYKLFVNGAFIGRGPARCEPLLQYYDEYDIAQALRVGRNAIAVLAHSYGRDLSWYELSRSHAANTLGCGGLFFECDGVAGIDSGGDWRYAIGEAWERDTPAGAVGFVEVYDARRDAGEWTAASFDDASWQEAAPMAATPFGYALAPPTAPFPAMVPRDIPPPLEEHRDAVAIRGVGEAPASDDMLSMAEAALEPLRECVTEEPEAMLAAGGAAMAQIAAGRALTLVVDFGRDVTGYPRLEFDAPEGVAVDVSYAEALRDDGRVPVQRPNPITSQNVHRYITKKGTQTWEKFDRAGFRYLQLTLSALDGAAAEVRIGRVNVNFTSYPVGERGSFACSDDALTRIWAAGQYTLQLCMQDGFEDCPSREQRQWVGDAHIESLVNYAAFGDAKLTAKLIRQASQSQMRDGMTQMATPGDISARWAIYIPDYCLSWIAATREDVMHTGDVAILDDVFPTITRAVAWFERHIADDLLFEPPGWIFIDWAEIDRRGACTVFNALLAQTLGYAAELADSQDAPRYAARWRDLAARIGAALNELLWDEARGVYVDALLADGRSRRVSQHANAVMISAGIAPRERWPRMLDYVMDAERLAHTSTGFREESLKLDEERQVVLAQPFFMHHVHRALVAAGRVDEMVENIRRRWSPMLNVDGTDTLWEHWHGRESRCHAWSATPTYELSREVLGVRPTSPGFATFRVEPSIAGLSWAEGRYPAPQGDVGVGWRADNGRFTLELDVPVGTVGEVVLPAGMRSSAGTSGLAAGRHVIDGKG